MPEPSTDRVLTVHGHGRAAQPADGAEVILGVDLVRPTAGEARDAAAEAMRAAIEAVERAGIDRSDIRTRGLSLGPEIEYRPDGTQRRVGFRLADRITVRLADPGRVAAVVDAAIAAGATALDGVSFRAVDDSGARRAALAAAVADARSAAEELAAAAGVTLAAVRSMREGAGRGEVPTRAKLATMESSAADTPILAGTTDVEADVEVTWDVTPAGDAGSAA